ncbi:hypothetical protein H5410_038042, partial [Solanum commersonii]
EIHLEMLTPINALNSSRNFLTKLIVVRVTEDQMDEDTDAYHRFYGMVRRIEMRKYERERMQKIRRSDMGGKKWMNSLRRILGNEDFILPYEADYWPKKRIASDGSIENSAWVGEDVSTRKSVLHSVKWERIILDEASHTFIDSCIKFLFSYLGTSRYMVRFLQVTPYACYFCEDCNCSGLDFSSYDVCSQCSHQPERHFLWWKNYIEKPLKAYENEGRDALVWLKYKILKSLMLRRTKKERAVDLALSTKTVTVRKDSLDEREYDYYKTLHDRSCAQFEIYAQIGHLMNNFGQILGMITPLRQAANHPYLVMYSRKELASGNKEAGDVEQSCVLCQDAVEDPVVTCCRHVFCRACMIYLAEDVRETPCPSCTKPLTFDFSGNKDKGDSSSKPTVKEFRSSSILNKIQLDKFKTSTKIEALKEEISDMFERDGSAKGIVFSQFTSFLDLIKYSLNLCGINCVQLVGSMSIAARDAALKRFTEDSNCKILLMSLKAGGVALNLTVASHCCIPSLFRIVRFVMENTIEERILELQEKKKLLFEGTIGGSSEALGKLTTEDLISRFGKPIDMCFVQLLAKFSREKIHTNSVAHIINDETTRKFLHSVKILVTFCQQRYPTIRSKHVASNNAYACTRNSVYSLVTEEQRDEVTDSDDGHRV